MITYPSSRRPLAKDAMYGLLRSIGMVALGCAAFACDADPAEVEVDMEVETPAEVVAETTLEVVPEIEVLAEVETGDPNPVPVGPRACCLAMEGDLVVWSDDGDLFMWDATTNVKEALVVGQGMQKDPELVDGLLVWADNRAGDFDLWSMRLMPTRTEPALFRGGPGDQDQPVMSEGRLVWVGRDRAPHSAREAEIFTMELAVADSERQLTDDGYEQTQPDIDGERIVWADFAHSPDAMYVDISDPLRNNADIYGWDLVADRQFIVTEDLSKQLRPSIDGDTIVWLDWRGINPEPKYSEFQVFVKRLGDAVERRVAWSSWSRPELWRRPAISGDTIVFIAEPSTPGTGFVTGLLAVSIDGGSPWMVKGSTSVLDSVVVSNGKAAFVGAGAIGRVELR